MEVVPSPSWPAAFWPQHFATSADEIGRVNFLQRLGDSQCDVDDVFKRVAHAGRSASAKPSMSRDFVLGEVSERPPPSGKTAQSTGPSPPSAWAMSAKAVAAKVATGSSSAILTSDRPSALLALPHVSGVNFSANLRAHPCFSRMPRTLW
jgi:hypothetical protein